MAQTEQQTLFQYVQNLWQRFFQRKQQGNTAPQSTGSGTIRPERGWWNTCSWLYPQSSVRSPASKLEYFDRAPIGYVMELGLPNNLFAAVNLHWANPKVQRAIVAYAMNAAQPGTKLVERQRLKQVIIQLASRTNPRCLRTYSAPPLHFHFLTQRENEDIWGIINRNHAMQLTRNKNV